MTTISPILQQTWGGEESWGNSAPHDARWSTLLASGCREGVELTRAWNILTKEAQEAANWLGEDVEHVFTVPLAGIGEGSVTGNTRGRIVAAREKSRALLLAKALALYQPRKQDQSWHGNRETRFLQHGC